MMLVQGPPFEDQGLRCVRSQLCLWVGCEACPAQTVPSDANRYTSGWETLVWCLRHLSISLTSHYFVSLFPLFLADSLRPSHKESWGFSIEIILRCILFIKKFILFFRCVCNCLHIYLQNRVILFCILMFSNMFFPVISIPWTNFHISISIEILLKTSF